MGLSPALSVTAAVFQLDRKNVIIADPERPDRVAAGRRPAHRRRRVRRQRAGQRCLEHPGRLRLPGRRTDRAASLSRRHGASRSCRSTSPRSGTGMTSAPAWGVGLGVIYQTEMFAVGRQCRDAARASRAWTRASSSTPNERLRLQLNVENLLDETLLPERPQQQQHHAGLAARGPCRGDRELLTVRIV